MVARQILAHIVSARRAFTFVVLVDVIEDKQPVDVIWLPKPVQNIRYCDVEAVRAVEDKFPAPI
jgi:hypothetical protein